MEKCTCCEQSKEQVERLIQISENVFICNECTAEINAIFAKTTKVKENKEAEKEEIKLLLPKQIKELLDESVIGQEDAKKALAVEIYNHYLRVNNKDLELEKNNILMIGDSGTGKTLLVKTLAKILDLPLAICDMSSITQSGYVGKSLNGILYQLVAAAGNDIKKAETGIIFLDEFDKLAKRNLTSSTDKDPSGEGVQFELLKMIEGTKEEIKIEGTRKDQYIDTSNILFIAGGAFFGMNKLLEKKQLEENYGIGFSASVEKPKDTSIIPIEDEDIIHFGFIPEIVGRLPIIVQLNKLTKEDYKRILIEPKNSIVDQYKKLLKLNNINLEFSNDYLDSIVEKVYSSKKGARALRGEIEKSMREIIYNINEEDFGKTIEL